MLDLADTTDDERFFLHSGRRWRKTDPTLPADVRARLMSHLGRGRSGVRTSAKGDDGAALPRARRTVQLAKEGLGERGTAWWDQTAAEREARWTAALEELDALHPKRPEPADRVDRADRAQQSNHSEHPERAEPPKQPGRAQGRTGKRDGGSAPQHPGHA
ncbi:hypothetical protein [Arthrobacter sp. Leaf234]|uniref:hypothetical protein n=1 Tax=Arthrobacter sp. Leaf234 TaxID=1736303 RepID=UPI0009EBDAB9|nr:hypothetical protein [Arthrobacter sp. Leaf234]